MRQEQMQPKDFQALVVSALTSDYVPTFSRTDQRDLAARFDKVMALVESPKRAWRGRSWSGSRRRGKAV